MDASFRLGLRTKPEDLCFIYSICSSAENPEIKFRAFSTKNLQSGGNSFNDFPENRLTKFRAVKQ